MQQFSRRWLQNWARMALFAMLAVLSCPAFAFACCCASDASVSTSQTPVAVRVAPGATHPGCHGHAETTESRGSGKPSVNRASVSSHRVALAVSTVTVGPSFQSTCECSHAQSSVMSFVETQNTSSFSPLVLGVRASSFSHSVVAVCSLCFAFASNAARPRGPDLALGSGRAPPAFSF